MTLIVVASIFWFLAVLLAAQSAGPVWDRISSRYVDDLARSLEALRMDRDKVPTYLRWWGVALVCAASVAIIAPPLAIAAVFFVIIAPRLWLKFIIRRHETQLRDQMVGASVALANASRAGLSLAQGINSVGKETPEPLAGELRRVASDFEFGLPLAEALNRAKHRLQQDGFTLFATAVVTASERGGKVTEALERISQSLQENRRLERKIDAETAAGRRTVMVLVSFPFIFLALFLVVYPAGTMEVFTSRAGQIILLLVCGLVYLSLKWCNKILTIDF